MDEKERSKWADTDTNVFSADSAAPGHDNLYDEEYAAEITGGAAVPRNVIHVEPEARRSSVESRTKSNTAGRTGSRAGMWGAIALLAALASWIVWPTVLGPVAVITGYVAFTKGRRALGGWAIALGLISFIVFLFAAY